LDVLLAKQGLSRNVKLVVPYFNAVPKIVSQTDLMGGLPNRLARQAMAEYPIQICAPPFPLPEIRFRMCWHSRRKHDLELQWFRATLKKLFDTL
jgi:DNA-binding transcriptional LysR family regulator